MSLNNFIPTAWAAALLENWNDKHVYVDLLNRDYEGDINDVGDSVKINSIGRVTVASYVKNSTSITPETLDDAQQVLLIDTADYYAFEIDDIDKAQQKPKLMGDAMKEAAWGLADASDVNVVTALAAGVQTANIRAAATAVGTGPTDDDAYEILVDLGVLLDNANVPDAGRWVVVPNWYHGVLLKDARFVSFGTDKNRETLKNGVIGEAAGFTIAKSNNVPVSGSAYTVIAGHKEAATFADQIMEPEGFRPENAFSDAMKGLHVYGYKVTRPYSLASCVATAA
jgi:hypothetical protein